MKEMDYLDRLYEQNKDFFDRLDAFMIVDIELHPYWHELDEPSPEELELMNRNAEEILLDLGDENGHELDLF